MKNFPRRKLCELITQYGIELCDDPVRCEGLLRDFCGKYKKEIFIDLLPTEWVILVNLDCWKHTS